MQILNVENLSIELGGVKILDNMSFEVNQGDVLAIIGPNGAGKTILFKTLLGLLPSQGKIEWRKGIKIGYVPQRMDIETDVPLTVKEFFKLRGKNSDEKIKEAISQVQLNENILNARFGEISTGQRQRILVAWAILGEPDVLLLDEPTADIDISGQESIYKTLHLLKEKLNLTVILISHDLNIVYKYAKNVICLNRKMLCYGTPENILNQEKLAKLYGDEKTLYLHHDHD